MRIGTIFDALSSLPSQLRVATGFPQFLLDDQTVTKMMLSSGAGRSVVRSSASHAEGRGFNPLPAQKIFVFLSFGPLLHPKDVFSSPLAIVSMFQFDLL